MGANIDRRIIRALLIKIAIIIYSNNLVKNRGYLDTFLKNYNKIHNKRNEYIISMKVKICKIIAQCLYNHKYANRSHTTNRALHQNKSILRYTYFHLSVLCYIATAVSILSVTPLVRLSTDVQPPTTIN